MLTSNADFGLIGHPLGHSFSRTFFAQVFAADASGRSYENFDLPALTPEALYSLLITNPKLKGFNVTAPYKQEIMQYLDEVSPLAARVGAVNTVAIRRSADGRVLAAHGFNTDVAGFSKAISPLLGERKAALILGTGGASKAVAEAFRMMGIDCLKVSRDESKGDITYPQIDADLLKKYPIVVNTTPLGTFPNIDSCPPIPYQLLCGDNLCFDLVYNPEKTLFMVKSAEHGAVVENGLNMLFFQAMEALAIWENFK